MKHPARAGTAHALEVLEARAFCMMIEENTMQAYPVDRELEGASKRFDLLAHPFCLRGPWCSCFSGKG